MSDILKIKSLWIGLFLALPLATALKLSGPHDQEPSVRPVKASSTVETGLVKIPVEVVAKGEKTEWVMVEVPSQPIPEPGIVTR